MLLIDAFNVLRAQWCLPRDRRGLDVRSLIARIGVSRYAHRRVRVVCDGRPGPEWAREGVLETGSGVSWTRVGHAEVVFSGKGREADDVIEDVLARSRGIAILLVSSDRRLVRAARSAKADQLGNGTFLKQLDQDARRASQTERPAFATDVPLDGASVRSWMREFGFDPAMDPGLDGGSGAGERAGLREPAQETIQEPVPETTPEREPAPKPSRKPPAARRPKPPASSGGFGTTLDIPVPAQPELTSDPTPGPDPAPAPPARASEPSQPEGTYEREPLDPVLADAFEEWRGRLDPDDLDMDRWIDGVTPLR